MQLRAHRRSVLGQESGNVPFHDEHLVQAAHGAEHLVRLNTSSGWGAAMLLEACCWDLTVDSGSWTSWPEAGVTLVAATAITNNIKYISGIIGRLLLIMLLMTEAIFSLMFTIATAAVEDDLKTKQKRRRN